MLLSAVLMAVGAVTPCAAGPPPDDPPLRPFSRVRSSHIRILRALREGFRLSPTFQRLGTQIDESSVIVYIEPGACRTQSAGCLTFVAKHGADRFLRVRVNPLQGTRRLVAMIGHELQHAVEIAGAPEVGDEASFLAFYERVGTLRDERSKAHETAAAIEAARSIDRELKTRH